MADQTVHRQGSRNLSSPNLSKWDIPPGVEILAPFDPAHAEILTRDALSFVSLLHREFDARRQTLLDARRIRQAQIHAGDLPSFPPESEGVRTDRSWQVAPTPPDLQNRRVEITGPTERKMLINALNSGASVFMADFEDANSPTWQNMVSGQINLRDAVDGVISFTSPDGKEYRLNDRTAVLMVRPRGWHLVEKHLQVDGSPVSGSLFDFGLYFFHNSWKLLEKGTGPYFYLPKLESRLEARLWNDVFNLAQDELGIPRGTVRATVLIENILAAFEMEEILYELRDHSAGLNAGRWDYIFSIIKKFRAQPGFHLPDRSQVTMTVPFMRAYTKLLVKTCHKRGAHAIGGMAAYIPSRKNAEVNEIALAKVREDKLREAGDGFDGTWVAHPDLVPVAMEVFDHFLGEKPHQKDRPPDDTPITAGDLIDFTVPGGEITEEGVRLNINVAILYIESWLRGVGAAALYNLMEDTATAEISRAQLWQWLHSPEVRLSTGQELTPELYTRLAGEEMAKIRALASELGWNHGKFEQARQILDRLVLADDFSGFLTLAAYDELNGEVIT